MEPLGSAPPEPSTRSTGLKVPEATSHPLFDIIVMRNRGNWITRDPEPEASGPQHHPVIGTLDSLLQSVLSSQTERALTEKACSILQAFLNCQTISQPTFGNLLDTTTYTAYPTTPRALSR